MKTLKDLYKVGRGPSSSHTMGPELAVKKFKLAYPNANNFKVILYGSLALTGKGHQTDLVIEETFAPFKVDIEFNLKEKELPHPNTFELFAYLDKEQVGYWKVLSVGGGEIQVIGDEVEELPSIYPLESFSEIASYCKEHWIRLYEYVEQIEGKEIFDYLHIIWKKMKQSIENGLSKVGVLDGGLEIQRKAKYLINQKHIDESAQTKENRIVSAYAFAVSEENASAGEIVTAPTCGASGVLPAVLKYMQDTRKFSDDEIVKALATAGIVGNLIKTNASISGAECGCQAEIGSACSMASAALAELFGLDIDQIEYAAEVAMEHHLGLTCDPIDGLVQIPCIERNAVAAMRAINAVSLANFLTNTRKISFDMVVDTMYETGIDLPHTYKETSKGGLAKKYRLRSIFKFFKRNKQEEK